MLIGRSLCDLYEPQEQVRFITTHRAAGRSSAAAGAARPPDCAATA